MLVKATEKAKNPIKEGDILELFDIRYDKGTGFPTFLVYVDKQWLQRSAKQFEPIDGGKRNHGRSL